MRAQNKYKRRGIKRFLPVTLFGRSLLILIVPVLLIQGIAAFVFFDNHLSKITARLAYAVAGEVALIVELIEDKPQALDPAILSFHTAEYLGLDFDFDPNADLPEKDSGDLSRPAAFPLWEAYVAHILQAELAAQLQHPFSFHIDLQRKFIDIYIAMDAGRLHVRLPERRLFSSSNYIFLLWLVLTSLVFLVVAVLFMRGQIRPIRRLAVAANRLGKGQDVPHVKQEGAREVRQAADAFRKMQERIGRQVSQRTIMLAGVSHDLRTPLTRLKLALSMMEDTQDTKDMKHDVQEMENMISGYLGFVQGGSDEAKELVKLQDILQQMAKNYERSNVKLSWDMKEDISLRVKPLAFERCLSNLIDNAAKYGQRIQITIDYDEDGDVLIVIEDDGPGIDPAHYEDVFKPFYRADEARQSDNGSVGLGLSIAMDVAHAHGGEIWLDKSSLGGLKVVLNIPV